MLLERYLPQYDVTETHAVVVDADTDRAASPIGCRGS
jgi:hypothetical protein